MRAVTLKVLLAVCAATAVQAQQVIPIRQVGPAQGSRDSVNTLSTVRPLSNGNVLLAHRGRLLLLDSALSLVKIALDSGSLGTALVINIPMFAGRGDTTLVGDRQASSFLVLDGTGKVVKVMAAPIARDMTTLAPPSGIRNGVFMDPQGRLLYRGFYPRPPAPQPQVGATLVTSSDSFAVVRANFETRTADTLGAIQSRTGRSTSTIEANLRPTSRSFIQPYPVMDAWTMLPDGTVAVARAADYHMDWWAPEGVRTSTPKMPFDWRRIADEDKPKIVDSVNAMYAEFQKRQDSLAAARGITNTFMSRTESVPASELPDYYPPIRGSEMRADPEGNVWLLPSTSLFAQGGLLYDIINRKGEIFERVQIPPKCALQGIGRGGVLFLICENLRLERRRVVRSGAQ